MDKNSRIYVAGHTGLLGSAIVRILDRKGYGNIITARRDFDLTVPGKVWRLFKLNKPEYVFMAAAKVGSIAENIKYPVEFLNENILIQQNVFAAAYAFKVKKLLFFSSNCCYPRKCPQPMKEEYLMTGPLEPTNEAFALAKILGMKLCQGYNSQYGGQFFCPVLASLYGPNDHFGISRAHVVADMIHKFHEAKKEGLGKLIFWGSGSPVREFLYVDDAADAAMFLMNNLDFTLGEMMNENYINVGTGQGVYVRELAGIIKELIGYRGEIIWDTSKPDGMPSKLLDSTKMLNLGWRHQINLADGIERTYKWYLSH